MRRWPCLNAAQQSENDSPCGATEWMDGPEGRSLRRKAHNYFIEKKNFEGYDKKKNKARKQNAIRNKN